MDSETLYTTLAPPMFDGDNYHIQVARMETPLEANDLWEAIEEDYEILPLLANLTMAQIKNQKERKTRCDNYHHQTQAVLVLCKEFQNLSI